MSKNTQPKRDLQDLGSRLEKARREARGPFEKKTGEEGAMSGAGLAIRITVELVSALAVGLGIGWVLDQWLGTRPWLMMVFILLGGAAGMLNVYRLATASSRSPENRDADRDAGKDEENR